MWVAVRLPSPKSSMLSTLSKCGAISRISDGGRGEVEAEVEVEVEVEVGGLGTSIWGWGITLSAHIFRLRISAFVMCLCASSLR